MAANLENVKVLSVKTGKENIEVKMQLSNSPKDSYFTVDIIKSEPEASEKIKIVNNKVRLKDRYKLDLEIPSFSPSPSGSYYRSNYVKFVGTSLEKKGK
jgi:hypothetical protein